MASLAPHVGIRSRSDLHLVLVGPDYSSGWIFFGWQWSSGLELMLTEGNECNYERAKSQQNLERTSTKFNYQIKDFYNKNNYKIEQYAK